ncbi:NTP transferase domain-containing protein [Microbacterium sp. cx-59]|uniref:nucleotidyltransferase family protein n=1 Tax=Microbacterium sp. cx-59 TaxID=2891207 RepID=UPI001E5CC0C9|nr:NTP transferase domain-containing protein [Microbacterium sp. cx-59]MCC4908551.1 NTP transferase domain-containing protein [Microbacterium sp. cx-59]
MHPAPSDTRVVGLVLAAGAGSRFGGPKGLARTTEGEAWVARAVRTLRDGGCGTVLVAVGAAADEVAALVPPDATVVRAEDWAVGLSASLRAGLRAAIPEPEGAAEREQAAEPEPAAEPEGAAEREQATGPERDAEPTPNAAPEQAAEPTPDAEREQAVDRRREAVPAERRVSYRGPDAVLVVTVDTPELPASAVARVIRAGGRGDAGLGLESALVQAAYAGRPGHPVLIGRAHVPAVVAALRGDRGAGPFLAAHGAVAVECSDLWSGADVDRR